MSNADFTSPPFMSVSSMGIGGAVALIGGAYSMGVYEEKKESSQYRYASSFISIAVCAISCAVTIVKMVE